MRRNSFLGTTTNINNSSMQSCKLLHAYSVHKVLQSVHPEKVMDLSGFFVMEDLLNDILSRLIFVVKGNQTTPRPVLHTTPLQSTTDLPPPFANSLNRSHTRTDDSRQSTHYHVHSLTERTEFTNENFSCGSQKPLTAPNTEKRSWNQNYKPTKHHMDRGISIADFEAANQLVFPMSLANQIIQESRRAAARATDDSHHAWSIANPAQQLFSFQIVKTLLQQQTDQESGDDVVAYVVAVLETITSEIVEAMSHNASQNEARIITPKQIADAIRGDVNLSKLLQESHILGGGVEESIPSLDICNCELPRGEKALRKGCSEFIAFDKEMPLRVDCTPCDSGSSNTWCNNTSDDEVGSDGVASQLCDDVEIMTDGEESSTFAMYREYGMLFTNFNHDHVNRVEQFVITPEMQSEMERQMQFEFNTPSTSENEEPSNAIVSKNVDSSTSVCAIPSLNKVGSVGPVVGGNNSGMDSEHKLEKADVGHCTFNRTLGGNVEEGVEMVQTVNNPTNTNLTPATEKGIGNILNSFVEEEICKKELDTSHNSNGCNSRQHDNVFIPDTVHKHLNVNSEPNANSDDIPRFVSDSNSDSTSNIVSDLPTTPAPGGVRISKSGWSKVHSRIKTKHVNRRHPPQNQSKIHYLPHLSNKALRTLAARSGIVKMHDDVFYELRKEAYTFLCEMVAQTSSLCSIRQTDSVTVQEVLTVSQPIYGVPRSIDGSHADSTEFARRGSTLYKATSTIMKFKPNSPRFFFCTSENDYDEIVRNEREFLQCSYSNDCLNRSHLNDKLCSLHCRGVQDPDRRRVCFGRSNNLQNKPYEQELVAKWDVYHMKSLEIIRECQRSHTQIITSHVMKKLLENILESTSTNMSRSLRFTIHCESLLCLLLEHYLGTLLCCSSMFAVHAGRITVDIQDVLLAQKFHNHTS
jgi:histone H3/H4